ncbi:hypothetical protein [Burkholderia sp. L27(2015)]|uniref:hypothetical protein n=1 Tax=Burkholderia sp. L27(2015) TaxID=1641858 RepID=UPI00131BC813|nr:hypothetical protein [Burkholderia sp. L27(2015)]
MRTLTIEEISHKAVSIRLIGTSHVFRINFNRVVKFSDILGLEKEELLLVGVVAGKVARGNAKLLCQYNFEEMEIAGDFRIKNINFDRYVTFIKNDKSLIKVVFREIFSNMNIINMISDEVSFYAGFLYGVFSLSSDELVLGNHPKPYLAAECGVKA